MTPLTNITVRSLLQGFPKLSMFEWCEFNVQYLSDVSYVILPLKNQLKYLKLRDVDLEFLAHSTLFPLLEVLYLMCTFDKKSLLLGILVPEIKKIEHQVKGGVRYVADNL